MTVRETGMGTVKPVNGMEGRELSAAESNGGVIHVVV